MTAILLAIGGVLLVYLVIKMAVKQAAEKGKTEAHRESLEKASKDVVEAAGYRDSLARSADERKRLREKYTRK
jgi:threonine/homoserine/homoserine lactone efflux protein